MTTTEVECCIDGETKSIVDLQKAGAYVYFENEETHVVVIAFAFGDEEPVLWWPGQPCPARIVKHAERGGTFTAWNSNFERLMWKNILDPRHGWPAIDDRQWRCTMAESHAMALPGKLDEAAPALGLDIVKDQAGHRLMLQMCRPRRIDPDGTIVWWDDADRLKRLGAYCQQDVRTERAIKKRVLRLRASEREMYWLDQQINDRGVAVDVDFCEKAAKVVELALARADKEMKEVTGGEVAKCSNVTQLRRWLTDEFFLPIEGLAADQLADLLLRDDLTDEARRALELRQEAAKTSTAKLKAVRLRTNRDGRMRGNLQYHGANTGRWAARGAQLQNLPRPVILKDEDHGEQQARAIKTIGWDADHDGLDGLDLLYGRPLTVVADTLRGTVYAGRGRTLRVVDFSNIEGRGVAWLAGQFDKLDAFNRFDSGSGADIYLRAAAGIYGVSIESAKPHRQIGKVAELALGYQGGPMAFAKMAKTYGLKIINAYESVWSSAEEARRDSALSGYRKRGRSSGLAEKAWLAAELIKLGWRETHPAIVEYWYALQRGAIEAMREPGSTQVVGPSGSSVQYRKAGSFLFCRLPSGRAICYPFPRLEMVKRKIVRDDGSEIERNEQRLVYKAKNQYTNKWEDKFFYGGLAAENITQAVARDIMAEAMLRVEKAGYPIVLTVHDEIVAESERGSGSFDEFKRLMTVVPTWAKGFPIAAAGWEGDRYRKG